MMAPISNVPKVRPGREVDARVLGRDLGIMASGTLASIALAFIIGIVVARLLGPEQLARYATVTVAGQLLAQLSDLGLANAFAFFARHRPSALRSLLRLLARHLAFSVLAAGACVWAAQTSGEAALNEALSPAWFSAVLVVFIATGTAANVLPVLVLARGDYRAYVTFANLTTALQLPAVVFVTAVAGPSWRGFIAGVTCVNAVVIICEAQYLRRVRIVEGDATVTGRECYRYGLTMKWGEVMKLLSGRIDLFVVASVLSAAQVGSYSIAMSFRELGMMPLRTYAGILQNLLVDRARSASDDRELVIGSLLLQFTGSVVLAIAAGALFPIVLPLLYGARYESLGGAAAILLASTVFMSLAGLCWIVFNMRGRPGLTSRLVTVSGVAGPFLVWTFARRMGLYGAATAGMVNSIVVCGASVAALVRLQGYRLHDIVDVARRVPGLIRDLRMCAAATPATGFGDQIAPDPSGPPGL